MPTYLVEFVVTEVRYARVETTSPESAAVEIKSYREQHDSEICHETVIITKIEEDE